ncbi:MAG: phage holin family protein [Flammeovirgaceae bacterium]
MDIKGTLIKFFKLDNFVNHLSGYIDTQVALVKLEVREEVARLLARSLVLAVFLLLAFLFLIFFSIGLAQYINSFFENSFVGYWLVSAIYGLPCIAFWLFKKVISKKIEDQFNEIIKQKEHSQH